MVEPTAVPASMPVAPPPGSTSGPEHEAYCEAAGGRHRTQGLPRIWCGVTKRKLTEQKVCRESEDGAKKVLNEIGAGGTSRMAPQVKQSRLPSPPFIMSPAILAQHVLTGTPTVVVGG